MLLHASQIRIVEAIILICIQRDLGKKIIPALHVIPPPRCIDILFRLVSPCRLGIIDQRHGQKIKAEQVFFTVRLQIGKARLRIFAHISDRDLPAECIIQGFVIGSVNIMIQD